VVFGNLEILNPVAWKSRHGKDTNDPCVPDRKPIIMTRAKFPNRDP